jgi:hypothetical protein
MPMTIDTHEQIGDCNCLLKTRDWQAIHDALGSVLKGASKRIDTEKAKIYQAGTIIRIDIKL